jgi:hypothetical protein
LPKASPKKETEDQDDDTQVQFKTLSNQERMYRLAQFDGDDHSVESTLDYTDWDEWRERYINEHLTKKKAKIEPTIDTKKDLHKPKSQRSEMRINHEAHHKKQK